MDAVGMHLLAEWTYHWLLVITYRCLRHLHAVLTRRIALCKVCGKGKLPEQPVIVKARYFTKEAGQWAFFAWFGTNSSGKCVNSRHEVNVLGRGQDQGSWWCLRSLRMSPTNDSPGHLCGASKGKKRPLQRLHVDSSTRQTPTNRLTVDISFPEQFAFLVQWRRNWNAIIAKFQEWDAWLWGIFRFKFCLPLVGQGCAEQLCRWAISDCLFGDWRAWRWARLCTEDLTCNVVILRQDGGPFEEEP